MIGWPRSLQAFVQGLCSRLLCVNCAAGKLLYKGFALLFLTVARILAFAENS